MDWTKGRTLQSGRMEWTGFTDGRKDPVDGRREQADRVDGRMDWTNRVDGQRQMGGRMDGLNRQSGENELAC